MKPTVRELPDEISYTWPDVEVSLVLQGLRPTDAGNMRALLKATSLRSVDQRNGASGRIFWSQVGLTTGRDRKDLAEALKKARPGPEWDAEVQRCFEDAYERSTRVPEPVDLADVQLESLDTRFLYDPVLPEGQVTILLADQGSTKSYLMEYLSACTVTGAASVFGKPRRSGPVIYFDWEVDETVARRRLDWICNGLGLAAVPRGLHYVNMAERGRLVDRAREMRYQIGRLQPVLVVIDSLTFATGGDLNSPEFAAPTMAAVGSLGNVTKLLSAHPSKASRNAGADEISVIGSGLFEFRARAIWLMKREAQRGASFMVSMSVRKPFDGAPSHPLAYRMRFDQAKHAAHFERGAVEDSPELRNQTLPLIERIERALGRRDLDTPTLALVCEATQVAVKSACLRMSNVQAKQVGGGRGKPTLWTLAPEESNGHLPF